jgi:hypothetical protein
MRFRRTRIVWLSVAGVLLPLALQAAEQVHSSNFEDAKTVSRDWSTDHIETTRRGGRKFLGEFSNDTVALTLKSLGPHQFVRISFDLLILKSWSGTPTDSEPSGPHEWGLRIESGPTLLHTTFANALPGRQGRMQTFPSLIPGEKLSPGTRGETNTLGYNELGGDSLYKLSFTFAHTDSAIQFCFFANNLEDVEDQSWGLDNVSVEILSADEVPILDEAGLVRLWEDFGTPDPAKGFDVAWSLISQGEQGVMFAERMLAAEMSKAPKVDKLADRVKQLVDQLDADQYRTRQRAMRDLLALGNRTVPLLRQSIKSPPSAEVRWRLEQVLTQLDDVDPATFSDDARRRERLISVLDIVGSARAKKLSERLAAAP